MLIVLSPAKTLDYTSPIVDVEPTRPEFTADARRLIGQLRELSPAEVAGLMSLSDSLATLNVERYAAFRARPRPQDARCAVLAFDGDVYDGLQARSLDTDGLAFTQRHLRILSGLYGVLRPLDALQPYRLEMGTRLANEHGRDLYAYWGRKPAMALRRALHESGGDTLVNLASEEYFRAVDEKALKAPIVQPVFQERRADGWKVISFVAKRARGAMARFAIDGRLEDPQGLKDFSADGWRFAPNVSDDRTWVFRREQP
ncbi:MAG: peroxide stress protein YaaA [Burkholderiaceae bacterium]